MRERMNLPNRLTLARILLVPVTVLLTETGLYPYALAAFVLAALTDTLDGYLARRNGQVTALGKFLDPVADKALVTCALICLCARAVLPVWFVCLVVFRDLIVDGLRLAAARKGTVNAAALSGKIKTVLQMILIAVCYVSLMTAIPGALITALVIAAAVMTAWSGAEYIMKMKDAVDTGEHKE